ncbi:MAG: c-type cytochrome [Hyphomicrobiaceae bacterium]
MATRYLIALLILSFASLATAQSKMSAQEGYRIARKLCSNCHAIDQQGATIIRTDVPSFRRIANRSQVTPERLAAAIIIPHPEMPGISVTRTEIQAIVAYIMSLKNK